MSFEDTVNAQLREALSKGDLDTVDLLNLMRRLAKWRHQGIANFVIAREGNVVRSGPFEGLRFTDFVSEGCTVPRLLGCYEHELHGEIERLVRQDFDTVLNIGCADGYYAVGLARRMPHVRVHAHDINEAAQAACRRVSEINGVGDRVEIGGVFQGADFARFAGRKTWLVLDIEGHEFELLDPDAFPELRRMTVMVECHDCFRKNVADVIARRFAPSHSVTRIDHALAAPDLPDCLKPLGQLDQLLATWEWRDGPTPWLIMEPR